MSWGMSTLRNFTFCHDNTGAVRNNTKKIFCMIKKEEAIMHILKNKGRRVNSPWFVYIRSSWICIVDINYTSCNKFNFVCKEILAFQSIFSSWKLPHVLLTTYLFCEPLCQLPRVTISTGETLLRNKWIFQREVWFTPRKQELMLALPLSRCKSTDDFTFLELCFKRGSNLEW